MGRLRRAAGSSPDRRRRYLRYALVSVISTLVALTVIAIVYGTGLVRSEVAATLVGNLVGAVPSYSLNRRWTWSKVGRSHVVREVIPFWVLAVGGIAFSLLGAAYAHHLVHTHAWPHLIDTAVVDGANVASALLFWVLKFLLLDRIFRAPEFSTGVLSQRG